MGAPHVATKAAGGKLRSLRPIQTFMQLVEVSWLAGGHDKHVLHANAPVMASIQTRFDREYFSCE